MVRLYLPEAIVTEEAEEFRRHLADREVHVFHLEHDEMGFWIAVPEKARDVVADVLSEYFKGPKLASRSTPNSTAR